MRKLGVILSYCPRATLEKKEAERVKGLIERATVAGYRLVREEYSSCSWVLFDQEDGECVHSAVTLDQIEQWLDE
ncbi:hypothetical protein IU500_15740 [Nocardia terpenica]|uniref:hypothetical protein n=1 Tax=Nocardia terpenica TaxID=455432 RepID=UPI0018941359|nr:hypothetical protein [Nocardia terpenica]MBF6061276.1 hypothetical protein [Nocardia terpenica]MBF6105495.1 hypothetical protein [Nocardia terpenica]MBF6113035.1 hypothetical protein [Nocardia terpenica]MBF6119165.1 hypothetical protein [Nocardia terpenica]MBF6152813.1 hypothetical protein [Nocardia terpenica]